MTPINENTRLLKRIKTKPLEKKVTKGTRVFKDVRSRERCKNDVLILKSEGYTYRDIGEYFNIDLGTIETMYHEVKKEVKAEFIDNRTDLVTEFFWKLKKELEEVREEMYSIDSMKDRAKYRDLIRKYIADQADLLGLKTIKVENVGPTPIEEMMNKFLESSN